jgi:putative oxidoreductase
MRALSLFGRLAYAVSIIVFGIQYLIYARGLAGPVIGPPWITGRPMWAYLVGLACIAAGLSIAANLKGRDTSILVAIALLLLTFLVYLPECFQKFIIQEP